MKFRYLSLSFLSLALFSCSRLTTVSVTMMEPGAISLGPDIKTVGIINRALPENKKVNKVESILTGEGIQEDKQGRQQLEQGLNNALLQSPRLKGKVINTDLIGNGTGTIFPAPMSWDSISMFCLNNGVDALVSLETYDSDCIITHTTGNVQVNNQMGVPIPKIQFYATQKINVKCGFRIYDPKNKLIIDQYNFALSRNYNTQANSLGEALAALYNRQMAINQICYDAGIAYERRISPNWMTEYRSMYRKGGSSEMAIGSRLGKVGNYQEASEHWKNVLNSNASRKWKGRAAYNLALASEVSGDLNAAKDWIGKAYGSYNCKKAMYYQNIINRRLNDIMRLDQQMIQSNDGGNNQGTNSNGTNINK